MPPGQIAAAAGMGGLAPYISADGTGLLLTPERVATDGFFLGLLEGSG
jgi:hypothetical protein